MSPASFGVNVTDLRQRRERKSAIEQVDPRPVMATAIFSPLFRPGLQEIPRREDDVVVSAVPEIPPGVGNC